nr:M20/M25/M40 family metallo-hydrolase [Kineococcus siccus]
MQEFEFPYFEVVGEPVLEVAGAPLATVAFDYSGSGDVTAPIAPVDVVEPTGTDNVSTSGCEASDFTGFPAGAVALLQRGTCPFADKVANAVAAEAAAVVIFNEGQAGRQDLSGGTLGSPAGVPVLGLSYADGAALVERAGEPVRVAAETIAEERTTTNVIADARGGDRSRTVVVGAHLDSVLDGPGINDNGSGTATILEIAEQMATLGGKDRQHVRFAFWGAEELGLLGATHYVDSLSDAELQDVYANLNFDMVGSPNYVPFVYDGDLSDTAEESSPAPPGSAQIERLLTDHLATRGGSVPTAFDGRSDYGPFIAAGIPAGGLFSGAEGVKTEEQAAAFGGTAGVAYDACYHAACDTIANLSTKSLSVLGDAAAHAVLTLARTRTGFYEDLSRTPKSAPQSAPEAADAA